MTETELKFAEELLDEMSSCELTDTLCTVLREQLRASLAGLIDARLELDRARKNMESARADLYRREDEIVAIGEFFRKNGWSGTELDEETA